MSEQIEKSSRTLQELTQRSAELNESLKLITARIEELSKALARAAERQARPPHTETSKP